VSATFLRQRGHFATLTAIKTLVTIRTKEAEAPSQFEPAKLFLDDIEQIVHILVEAAESRKETWKRENSKTEVMLAVKDQVCDEVQELPRIAMRTNDLSVRVEVKNSLPQASLTFSKYSTQLRTVGFTREQELSIYHNVAVIFKRRNRWLATFVRSYQTLIRSLFVSLFLVFIALSFKKQTPLMVGIAPALLSLAIGITALVGTWQHSVIILRRSSERDEHRQDQRTKALLVFLGYVLAFVLGLVSMYLKHKYWP
jgi:hypothetical protein